MAFLTLTWSNNFGAEASTLTSFRPAVAPRHCSAHIIGPEFSG